MPVEIRWLDEGRLIYERFYDHVTTDDLAKVQAEFRTMLESSTQRVHSVIDFSTIEQFPRSLTQIRDSLSILRTNQLGWIILITKDNATLKFLGSVITQVMIPGANFTICATLQEAIAFIIRQDSSIKLSADILP